MAIFTFNHCDPPGSSKNLKDKNLEEMSTLQLMSSKTHSYFNISQVFLTVKFPMFSEIVIVIKCLVDSNSSPLPVAYLLSCDFGDPS